MPLLQLSPLFPSPCVCLGFFGNPMENIIMGLLLQVCPHAVVHCGKEWKWRAANAGVGWEFVPERSAAVARSQRLPWEAKNPSTSPADETEAMTAPAWASASCLLRGVQPLPLPQGCSPRLCEPCSWAVLTSNSLLCINSHLWEWRVIVWAVWYYLGFKSSFKFVCLRQI